MNSKSEPFDIMSQMGDGSSENYGELAEKLVQELFADSSGTERLSATQAPNMDHGNFDISSIANAMMTDDTQVANLLSGLNLAPPPVHDNYYFLNEPRPPSTPTGAANSTPKSDSVIQAPVTYTGAPFNVEAIRKDFPILNEQINGRTLAWLDNAATTQKPNAVIDRISEFYRHEYSNIHRAAHTLAARSTDAYESSRKKVAQFLNASSADEIVFVRGATEAINLVAQSWGRKYLRAGDEILITSLEHHSNIVPWQLLAAETGAKLVAAPIDQSGQVRLDQFERLLGPRTKLVSITHVSNALGTVNPVEEMTFMAHRHGARVLIDGAQAVSHMKVDVQKIQPDFYVFSGHKVFGPTGIGVLYGTQEVLSSMPPWQGGGNMIADVTLEKTVYNPAPSRFEAGTGNIADAVGLGAAIDYISKIGMGLIAQYEHDLLVYAESQLREIKGLRIIGNAKEKAGVISFVLNGYQPGEVGQALNQEGIAVRSGHHCAQPTLRFFGLEASVRPSLAFYNTKLEIDRLTEVVRNLQKYP